VAQRAWLIVAAAALAACGGGDGGPSGPFPGPLGSIIVAPPSATIAVGDTLRFHATEIDSTGHFVLQFPINWGVTDQTVAQISDSGLVQALAAGIDTVVAIAQGKVGRAILHVS
jgi:hypothetical protein